MSKKFMLIAGLAAVTAALFLARPQSGTALAADDEPKTAIQGFKVGDVATVYLRGDACGAVFSDRVPALGNMINRTGKIVSADNVWVILDTKGTRVAVPRESIAMLEIAEK